MKKIDLLLTEKLLSASMYKQNMCISAHFIASAARGEKLLLLQKLALLITLFFHFENYIFRYQELHAKQFGIHLCFSLSK